MQQWDGVINAFPKRITCWKCFVGFWNMYFAPQGKDDAEQMYCYQCWQEQPKRCKYQIRFFWKTPDKMNDLFYEHCNELNKESQM